MAEVVRERFKLQQLGMVVVVVICSVVHLASSLRSCTVSSGKLRIANSGIGYFRSDLLRVQVRARLRDDPSCKEVYKQIDLDMDPLNVDYAYDIDINELLGINTTVVTASGRRRRDLWYEVSVVPCEWKGLYLRIGGHKRKLPLNQTIVTELQTLASFGILGGRRELAFPCYPTHIDFQIKGGKLGCPRIQHDGDPRMSCAETIPLPTLSGQLLPRGHSELGLVGPGDKGRSLSGRGSSSEGSSSSGSSESGSISESLGGGESSSGGSSESNISMPLPPQTPSSLNLPSPPPFFPAIPDSIFESIHPPDVLREADLPPDHTGVQDTYDFRGRGEENAVPIFIGVLAFSLSMCLRFCLCRGKSVVQRVTTVTVIRSRPTGEEHESQENVHDASLDPPPAYVDVVNESSGTCHSSSSSSPVQDPPPPPYSDIDPPPYYELEGVGALDTNPQLPHIPPQQTTPSPQPPHTSQLQRTRSAPTEQQEPSETTPGSVGSNLARALHSRTRSLHKQFSFRPLEEEGEEEEEEEGEENK